MASAKEMLEAILLRSLPKRGEKEAMESMWDQLHRAGKLSPKQKAWVEKVYFDQKLDRADVKPPPTTAKVQVGVINTTGVTQPIRVSTLAEFEKLCPEATKGSQLWSRVASFLADAGHVIELRPPQPKDKK